MGWDRRNFTPEYRKQIEQKLHGNADHFNPQLGSESAQHEPVGSLDSGAPAEVRGVGPFGSRPRVTITMYRIGELDADNKWFAPKALLDGLVASQIIPGDSERDIEYFVEQVHVHSREEIKTVIVVQSVTAQKSI